MEIIVPIKQVPETSNVKMDPETGTMLRTAVEGIVNPLDLFAIEAALRLREANGGTVTAITMGPPKAENALRDALAMGCDQAVLLSDRRFGGSDTWATSHALAQAIKKLSPFDLVICGERATDGETGQVGPGIAAWLDLPLATYVSQVIDAGTDFLRLERFTEGGREVIWSPLPMVLTVVKEIGNPRLGTIRSKLKARKVDIPTWGADDIEANQKWIGLKGSPTRVVKIYSPQLARKGQVIEIKEPEDLEKAGAAFAQFLKDRDLTNFIPHYNDRE
ncbi:MAG: electron transfer flavoprotein subunit beta/FixA family protein [Anaerolineaceae bacterium]|jgi:electron transfer flavoprotein beta subunit|nr:electron transfer flavoprotein subunit beta/FixA family protein [Anaerolineaceae bacterium]